LDIEREQPQAVNHLILHLIFARGSFQTEVQVINKTLDSVELVEGQTVVVNPEEHLQTPTQSIPEAVL
jgi:hypothetical protein